MQIGDHFLVHAQVETGIAQFAAQVGEEFRPFLAEVLGRLLADLASGLIPPRAVSASVG